MVISQKINMSAVTVFALLSWGSAEAATQVTGVDFKTESDANVVEIRGSSPLTYTTQENVGDQQLVIELTGAQLGPGMGRPLDTTSFGKSRVSMVSPYAVEGEAGKIRVVIQMNDYASPDVTAAGNVIRVKVPLVNSGANKTASTETSASADLSPGMSPPPSDAQSSATAAANGSDNGANPASGDKLSEFVGSQATKRFTGKKISLQVRDAEIADVLRLIGDASGFNIIVADNVAGKVTLSLAEVPWDQALDVLLHTKQLGAERNGNILRVMTLTSLVQEKQAELDAKKASQASAIRITKVFPISYAKISDLQPVLEKFRSASKEDNASGEPSVIQIDERTNQMIVRDLPENVEKIQKLLELLDTQTPQVMIEAKIIESSEEFSKTLNGSLALGNNDTAGTNALAASFNGSDPTSTLFSSSSAVTGTTFSSAAAKGSAFGMGQTLSFLPGTNRLNALLTLGEQEKQLRVLSSPKLVVLNRESATITSGTPVSVRTQQTVAGVGVTSVENVVQANLSLNVKPTVTNDGSVLMELKITRDQPFGAGVANRSTDTRVLVESGNTLVIGGIYQTRNETQTSGIPILRKIPIIGALFGSEGEKTERTELFIFVTPRIINEKESGMSG